MSKILISSSKKTEHNTTFQHIGYESYFGRFLRLLFRKSLNRPRWSDTTRRMSSLYCESLATSANSSMSLIHLSARSLTTFKSLMTSNIIWYSGLELQLKTSSYNHWPVASSLWKSSQERFPTKVWSDGFVVISSFFGNSGLPDENHGNIHRQDFQNCFVYRQVYMVYIPRPT